MILLVFMGLAIIAAIAVPFVMKDMKWYLKIAGWVVCGLIFFFCFFQTSFIIVGGNEVCHLDRVYMGESMQPGQIIALPWQKGPQARVLTAGFHFLPFIRVTHDLEFLDVVKVPEGKYGFLVAKDEDISFISTKNNRGLASTLEKVPELLDKYLEGQRKAKEDVVV